MNENILSRKTCVHIIELIIRDATLSTTEGFLPATFFLELIAHSLLGIDLVLEGKWNR